MNVAKSCKGNGQFGHVVFAKDCFYLVEFEDGVGAKRFEASELECVPSAHDVDDADADEAVDTGMVDATSGRITAADAFDEDRVDACECLSSGWRL